MDDGVDEMEMPRAVAFFVLHEDAWVIIANAKRALDRRSDTDQLRVA